MEGDGHRVTSRLMEARSGREALGDADDLRSFASRAGCSDPEVVALDRCVLEESFGSTPADELQAMKIARRVADGSDQCTSVHPQSMR